MKALKDFNHLGVSYKEGDIVHSDMFDPEDYPRLMQKGLIGEVVLVEKSKEVPAPSSKKSLKVAGSRENRSRKDK